MLPPADMALSLAIEHACRALAHPGRRAMVTLLALEGPQCMRQFAARFPRASQQALSLHLRKLRQAGIVRALPRRRRAPLDRSVPLEAQALQALAQSSVDGRTQRYALSPQPLALVATWLGECVKDSSSL